MIPRLKAALGINNSEKQGKVMLVKSDLENLLKEKAACYRFVKEGITRQ